MYCLTSIQVFYSQAKFRDEVNINKIILEQTPQLDSMHTISKGARKSISLEPFSNFLKVFEEKLRYAFYKLADVDQFSLQHGVPPAVMHEIMSCNPLSISIPVDYGGRGGHAYEGLTLLTKTSYESLALSLAFGINLALFLQPVAKYGQEEVKAPIFERFLKDKTMGGLMLTEPNFGTDALNMQSSFVEHNEHYHLKGTKHWQGLTSWADFWLITARGHNDHGKLKRDINFFICDVSHPDQEILVEEMYDNLGLYLIPYGRNKVNVQVPKTARLEPRNTGLKMLLDILNYSRLMFPGMAVGFIKRMLDEALNHCKERFIGGKSLLNYDQMQQRLARLQASFTISSAMCSYTDKMVGAGTEKDLSSSSIEANVFKSVSTDLMQEASQSALQMLGAKGYRLSHVVGRGTVDSRSFQIFEGPNDVLYTQVSEAILKLMKKAKEANLYEFLKNYDLTARAASTFKELLNFNVDLQISQRKLTELGRILGRVISLDLVLRLGDSGFRKDLIVNALAVLEQEINNLVNNYNFNSKTTVIEEYGTDSSWFQLV